MRTGVRVYPSSALVEASCHRFKRKPLSAVAGSWAVLLLCVKKDMLLGTVVGVLGFQMAARLKK
jgi:hypothetical protein